MFKNPGRDRSTLKIIKHLVVLVDFFSAGQGQQGKTPFPLHFLTFLSLSSFLFYFLFPMTPEGPFIIIPPFGQQRRGKGGWNMPPILLTDSICFQHFALSGRPDHNYRTSGSSKSLLPYPFHILKPFIIIIIILTLLSLLSLF